MREKSKVLLLLVGSTVAGLFMAEGLVRYFSPQPLAKGFFQPDAHVGYVHRPHLSTVENRAGQSIPIQINGQGLRQLDEVSTQKKPGEFRVLCLGDSFAFGWGVLREEGFVARLEALAKKEFPGVNIRFLNAGHGGYDTHHMVAYLENHGFVLNPDFVILFFGPNDIEENTIFKIYDWTSRGTIEPHEIQTKWKDRLQNALIESGPYQWLISRSHLLQVVRKALVNVKILMANYEIKREGRALVAAGPSVPDVSTGPMAVSPQVEEGVYRLTEAVLARANDDCKVKNIPFLVETVGVAESRTATFWKDQASWFPQHHVEFSDASAQMAPLFAQGLPLTIPGDSHYNPEGNRRFAEFTWPSVRDHLKVALKAFQSKNGS